jgi:hypothetical protein
MKSPLSQRWGVNMFCLRFCLVVALALPLALFTWFLAPAQELTNQIPRVASVEAQPLLAQVKRLEQALDMLGDPLPVKETLQKLKVEQGDTAVATAVQTLLDPLCLVAIEISKDGSLRLVPVIKQAELVEQGWRTFLVKVVNLAQSTGEIKYDSPNAKPVPRGEQSQVAERWLDVAALQSQPLLTKLSGLDLEYRVLQLYCRDPGEHDGKLQIKLAGKQAEMPLHLVAKPATKVTFQVREVDGTPCMGCFDIRDERGRVYPSPAKRLAPDFFFQSQIYRESGESILLPAGKYTVRCSRGPESVPEEQKITVSDQPTTISYQVKRWIDPSKYGWWSGDHHIHAAGCAHYEKPTEGVHPPDMMRHCLGEDLKVGCCLTWGPCFDYQKRFFSGHPDPVSREPYLLRYDVEVSGFGSHQSGHLCLLRLKDQMYPGGDSKEHWPTLGLNTLRWAKKQGAVCGPAHSGNGLTEYTVPRMELKWSGDLVLNDYIPLYNGIGANEYIMDIAHEVPGPAGKLVPAVDFISSMDTDRRAEWNMWYHSLNAGFRVRVSGETDFPCIYGQRVGIGRVYCKQKALPNYDEWCQAIADGQSYVSDGTTHLIDFQTTSPQKVEMGVNGSELRLDKPGTVTFSLQAAARLPNQRGPQPNIELIINGRPVASEKLVCDGKLQTIQFRPELEQSCWVACRVYPHAHTNPIFVIINNKPIREKASIDWCLKGVDQCWKEKKRTYKPEELADAEAAYEHARKVYRQRLAESN